MNQLCIAVPFFQMFISEPVEGPGSFDDSHWEKIHEKDTQAVLWVPDHAATHCFGCNSQFWLAKRRHHCRYVYICCREQQCYDVGAGIVLGVVVSCSVTPVQITIVLCLMSSCITQYVSVPNAMISLMDMRIMKDNSNNQPKQLLKYFCFPQL